MNAIRRSVGAVLVPALLVMTGCQRSPTFDILGSFFPAWIFCFVAAVLLTAASRVLLSRYVDIVWPVLVYPSLAAFFSFALWITLFR
jgi:hypothetical protein